MAEKLNVLLALLSDHSPNQFSFLLWPKRFLEDTFIYLLFEVKTVGLLRLLFTCDFTVFGSENVLCTISIPRTQRFVCSLFWEPFRNRRQTKKTLQIWPSSSTPKIYAMNVSETIHKNECTWVFVPMLFIMIKLEIF